MDSGSSRVIDVKGVQPFVVEVDGLRKDMPPLGEGLVGGDGQALALSALGDEFEQH